MKDASLLSLLQLCDSLFPSGGFTHSYGLETLVREGRVRNATELERYVRSVIALSMATAEALAARCAAAAARDLDLPAIVALDRAYVRTKAAAELRAAVLQTGRRMTEEVSPHVEDVMLRLYQAELARDAELGAYPVAFGVAAAAMGVEEEDIAPALMLASAGAMLQAAMRLMRVSHRDVQGILHRLRPSIAELADTVSTSNAPLMLRSFNPLQEIASMRHARAEARLFAS